VSTSNVVIPALLVPQLLQPVRIGILSANLVQDRRDNPADAHRGIYNVIDTGLASGIFGSQRSFGKVLVRQATYTPFRKTWVFARQLTFGAIFPFSVPAGFQGQNYIPLPERFFGGGADTNRGFPYNEAGPRDIGMPAGPGGMATVPTGFPLGGDAVFFHQSELRFPLIGENIGGVLFHDMGNVYSTVGDISFRVSQRNLQDFNYMVHAAGFGIRYKTPVGPLRLDLAYSINPPSFTGFKGTIAQLVQCNPNLPAGSLPSFCTPVVQSTSHFQFFFSIGQAF
jgi:outer membrane protein assembly factor BamA